MKGKTQKSSCSQRCSPSHPGGRAGGGGGGGEGAGRWGEREWESGRKDVGGERVQVRVDGERESGRESGTGWS